MKDLLLAECFQLAANHADRLVHSADPRVRLLVAMNPLVDDYILAVLVNDEDAEVGDAAKNNPATSWHLQEVLAGAKRLNTYPREFWISWESMEEYDASNPGTPTSLLAELSRSLFIRVRVAVSRNTNTTSAILTRLARDQSERVRASVAGNPKISRALSVRLAEDVTGVVAVLATNPEISETVVRRLSFHSDERVRVGVASNKKTPLLLLRMLVASDTSAKVRKSAIETLRSLGDPYIGSSVSSIPEFDVTSIELKEFTFLDHRPKLDAIAMHAVIYLERNRGHTPYPMPHNNKGFDIRSVCGNGKELFLEVKGVGKDSKTVHVSRSQIEHAKRSDNTFVLAIVETNNEQAEAVYYFEDPYPENLAHVISAVTYDIEQIKLVAEKVYCRVSASVGVTNNMLAASGRLF